jgi:hypothetical protein
VKYIFFILVCALFFISNNIFAQTNSKKFDIQFQLKNEIKNINKACLPCGRIGNKIIDSLNRKLNIDYCNKVLISKKSSKYRYYAKFNEVVNIDSVLILYLQSEQVIMVSKY